MSLLKRISPYVWYCGLFCLLLSSGCTLQSRQNLAQDIAEQGHLQAVVFPTTTFTIQGYQRFQTPSKPLVVYLEGDGSAWKNRHTLAHNPTPRTPTALRLASLDPAANILYLARPCQYITTGDCAPQYWSSHRYSPEIVQAVSTAINQAIQTSHTSELILIGYSGGGVVATLLAATRHDVKKVITVAANLDIEFWAQLHNVSPLWGSDNPGAFGETLQHIPQIHIVGARDQIVPPSVSRSYIDHLPNPEQVTLITIQDADHRTNWVQKWPALLSEIRSSTINSNRLYLNN